jgi:hypothetical protein
LRQDRPPTPEKELVLLLLSVAAQTVAGQAWHGSGEPIATSKASPTVCAAEAVVRFVLSGDRP